MTALYGRTNQRTRLVTSNRFRPRDGIFVVEYEQQRELGPMHSSWTQRESSKAGVPDTRGFGKSDERRRGILAVGPPIQGGSKNTKVQYGRHNKAEEGWAHAQLRPGTRR